MAWSGDFLKMIQYYSGDNCFILHIMQAFFKVLNRVNIGLKFRF